jgi:putative membrane protein
MGRAVGAFAVLRVAAVCGTMAYALPVSAHTISVANVSDASVGASSSVAFVSIAFALAVTCAAYAGGVARLWQATATGRGIRIREAAAFAAGWLALALALLGPLDGWAERSFAAHMLQHEILMLIAAPLLVLGRPLAAWTWALPPSMHAPVRRGLASPAMARPWRMFTRPLGATILQLAVLFVLHVPRIFDYAATHAAAHAAQHTAFLASALCFWWATRATPSQRGDAAGVALGVSLACLFVTMLATGALGALLTFASAPGYPVYANAVTPWSANGLEDQQLGGLIMWIPGGAVYLITGLLRARELLARSGPVSSGVTGAPDARAAPTSIAPVRP